MRGLLICACGLAAAVAATPARAQSTPPRAPLSAPPGGDPLLSKARERLPGCTGPIDERHVEGAKGLHTAAAHLFSEARYELARDRWQEAYTFDCTAHRLLLNIASAEERMGHERAAWQARALYVERSGDEEMAARVKRERPSPPHRPIAWRTGLGFEFLVWPTVQEGTSFGLTTTGRLRYGSLLLELSLPVGWWLSGARVDDPIGRSRDEARAAIGNPIVAAHYVLEWPAGSWRLGALVGAPLGAIDDVDWQATSMRLGQAHAWRRWGRWAPESVPLGAATELEWRLAAPLVTMFDAQATVLLPAGHTAVRMPAAPSFGDTRVKLALEARGGFEIAPQIARDTAIGGGVLGQVVWMPTATGDAAQGAIDLWAVYRRGRFVGRLGSLWALDGPLGWAFEPGRVLTVHLDVAVALD